VTLAAVATVVFVGSGVATVSPFWRQAARAIKSNSKNMIRFIVLSFASDLVPEAPDTFESAMNSMANRSQGI
jgi:hypothetical protein